MEKLKKLKSWISIHLLYHYQITTNKEDFYRLKGSKYNIRINGDETITFNCGKKTYNEVKSEENIIIKNLWSHHLNVLFVKRILFTILFLLILMIFIQSNRIIREIKFIDQDLYDQRIYDYVYKKLDKKGFIYTYEHDLNELSLELRANFPNYAYIGVTRNASCLLIDIEKIDIKKNEEKMINHPCDIVSNSDGVIYSIESKTGVVRVELNQFVKKGDLLISGNLLIDFNENDPTKLVESQGIIVGTILQYKTITVKKEKKIFTITNDFKKRINIEIGNQFIFKFKDYYENQKVKLTKKFSLFNLIKFYEEKYYKQDYLEIIYDYESAYNYAISIVYYELELSRVSPDEEIVEIKMIGSNENKEEYIFYFVVKKRQNIGIKKYY